MSKKIKIFYIISICVLIIIGLIFIDFSELGKSNQITHRDNIIKILIERSEPQGDFAYDNRSPLEVCNNIKKIQDLNPNLICKLIDSKRIGAGSKEVNHAIKELEKECVDGSSIAGCFSCIFECSL